MGSGNFDRKYQYVALQSALNLKTWKQFNLVPIYAISLPSHSNHRAVSQSKGGLILVSLDK